MTWYLQDRTLEAIARESGVWLGYAAILFLCATGLAVSCVTFSGTWLVVLATILAVTLPGDYPGWNLVFIFMAIALCIEAVEWFASSWGVQRRGGSRLAGVAALVGGIAGLILGTFIPIPIVGSLIGMLLGSFTLAYAAERHRLKAHDHAMHIAWGTVTARILVLFVKIGATLGMIAWLAVGMLAS